MDSVAPAGAARWRRELVDTLHLAGPLVLGQLSAVGMNVVDTVLAGHYDAATLAAVAIGTNVWSLAIVAAIGVMLAVPPAPGISPMATSGRRKVASGRATTRRQKAGSSIPASSASSRAAQAL